MIYYRIVPLIVDNNIINLIYKFLPFVYCNPILSLYKYIIIHFPHRFGLTNILKIQLLYDFTSDSKLELINHLIKSVDGIIKTSSYGPSVSIYIDVLKLPVWLSG